jgi:hypothetical protein
MPGVVQQEKCTDYCQSRRARTVNAETDKGAEWKPARPNKSVANGSKRTCERAPKTLNPRRVHALELGACERSNRDTGEIWMRVEVARFAREGSAVLGTSSPAWQKSECGLHHEAYTRAEQRLVIPRALHGKQSDEHREPHP